MQASYLTRLQVFFTAPISAKPLGLFRILISAFAIIQALVWYPDWTAFFSESAWIQWEVSEALNEAWRIHLRDLHSLFEKAGLNPDHTVKVFFWFYLGSLLGLLAGWYTKIWAFLSWACHYLIMSTVTTFVYGVDIFLHISLFYMLVMPVAKEFSMDSVSKRVSSDPDWTVTLSIRVLQLHLCLVYLSAGFEKLIIREWWDGNVLWRSLVQPDFRQFNLVFLADYPLIVQLASWFTIIAEFFYCVAMWIPKLRVGWLFAMILLHLGIGLFLGLWFFGLIMILLSISAFGFQVLGDIKSIKTRISIGEMG